MSTIAATAPSATQARAGFVLPSAVTVFDAAAVLGRLEAALATLPAGATFVVDAAPLQRFDSSAVSLLLQARRLATAQGRRAELLGVPPRLSELARLYGVGELL